MLCYKVCVHITIYWTKPYIIKDYTKYYSGLGPTYKLLLFQVYIRIYE